MVENTLIATYYEGFQVIGGNTEPDLVKENIQVEIKARTRREPPNADMLNQKELQHLKTGGNLELCLVSFQPGQWILEIYDIIERKKEEPQDECNKKEVSHAS